MFSSIRLGIAGAVIISIIGAFWYVSGLRADLEQSQQNVETLKSAVQEQSRTITQLREDQEQIIDSRNEIRQLVTKQRDEIDDLRSRFNESSDGSDRDFGKLAMAKPGLVQNIVNNASQNAIRCVEIASGSELTQEEQNEGTNSECSFDSAP